MTQCPCTSSCRYGSERLVVVHRGMRVCEWVPWMLVHGGDGGRCCWERLGELLDPRLDGTVPLHEFMQVGGCGAVRCCVLWCGVAWWQDGVVVWDVVLLDPRLDGTMPLHEFMQRGGWWCCCCELLDPRLDGTVPLHEFMQVRFRAVGGGAQRHAGGICGSGVPASGPRLPAAHGRCGAVALMPPLLNTLFLFSFLGPCPMPLHQAASVAAVCLQADPDYQPHMDDVVQSRSCHSARLRSLPKPPLPSPTTLP
ncbi:unnamed protein product [Closterium sp. Yama58-4]|nr:unnamed protein product [Closterium sp. Yama58-4]